ncbi:hypothetical protein BD408DRAFT_408329 [Parasitella parasitica]|nr:hypothetical protein BD408DRAFT_408329 [Parasitella parasitica]
MSFIRKRYLDFSMSNGYFFNLTFLAILSFDSHFNDLELYTGKHGIINHAVLFWFLQVQFVDLVA